MPVTLIVIRHAKSDWKVPASDRDRPLARRGRRQAPKTGRWIGAHLASPDLAVVSVAARARQTWEAVAGELGEEVPVQLSEAAYTFAGRDLRELVAELPAGARTVVLVSHNPAVEELIESLTGDWVPMPTSALAVIELPGWAGARQESGHLVAAGRPADERWAVTAPR